MTNNIIINQPGSQQLTIVQNTKVVVRNNANDYVDLYLNFDWNNTHQLELEIEIEAACRVNIFQLGVESLTDKALKLTQSLQIGENAICNYYNLDLLTVNNDFALTTFLSGAKAQINYYLASLSVGNYQKRLGIKTIHCAPSTLSNIKTYSICKDASSQILDCQTQIDKGMKRSEAHQELRLLVFDKQAKAYSDPVLLIDENDIIASHANAVGMLDPDQLFYLQARGLSINAAKILICMSYFKVVLDHIEEESRREAIMEQVRNFF